MTDGGMPENDLRQPPLLTVRGERAVRNHRDDTVRADQSDIVVFSEEGATPSPRTISPFA